jgi:hypothetical protein
LLDIDTIPRMFKVIFLVDDVSALAKSGDLSLEFVEALISPTKFHLGISQSNAHSKW